MIRLTRALFALLLIIPAAQAQIYGGSRSNGIVSTFGTASNSYSALATSVVVTHNFSAVASFRCQDTTTGESLASSTLTGTSTDGTHFTIAFDPAPDHAGNCYVSGLIGGRTDNVPTFDTGTSVPATCAPLSFYLKTDTKQLYTCNSSNKYQPASFLSDTATNRPTACDLNQIFIASDTGTMSRCSVAGNPGTWASVSVATTTASNLAGGSAGQYPYQTGAGATGFRTPNAANGPAVLDANSNLPLTSCPTGTPAGSVCMLGQVVSAGVPIGLSGLVAAVTNRHYDSVATVSTTIAAALAAISDASVNKRYLLVVPNGSYTECGTQAKDFVDIIGQSRTGVLWSCTSDVADTLLIGGINTMVAHMTINHSSAVTPKYSIHADAPGNSVQPNNSSVSIVWDVAMTESGTAPKSCIGTGTRQYQYYFYIANTCTTTGNGQAGFLVHNYSGGAQSAPSEVWLVANQVQSTGTNGIGLDWENYGTGQPDKLYVLGGFYSGTLSDFKTGNTGGGAGEAIQLVDGLAYYSTTDFSAGTPYRIGGANPPAYILNTQYTGRIDTAALGAHLPADATNTGSFDFPVQFNKQVSFLNNIAILPRSTTSYGMFRALDGQNPTSPTDGDHWLATGVLKYFYGGTTYGYHRSNGPCTAPGSILFAGSDAYTINCNPSNLVVDNSTPSAPKIGIGVPNPARPLDVNGAVRWRGSECYSTSSPGYLDCAYNAKSHEWDINGLDVWYIDTKNHFYSKGIPSAPASIAGCGTGASLAGEDKLGEITLGTTPGTCVVTFGQSYATAPRCTVTFSAGTAGAYSASTTALTITATGLTGKVNYWCAQ